MRGAGSSSRTTIAVKVGAPTAPPPTAPTPLRSPPIIFLDIDGVLNRTVKNTHIRLDADLVARLREAGADGVKVRGGFIPPRRENRRRRYAKASSDEE